ncbi:hypothetical protein EWH99_01515 [Sporolactobacillus sp. THM7-7]|nr:hypothetical protein EWH99_01515 [Sporolactobacillus sp. THM7-7]
MKKKIGWTAGLAVALIMLSGLAIAVWHDERISKSEMEKQISAQYGGKVVSFDPGQKGERDVYTIGLANQQGSYRIIVDAETGDVMHLSKVKAASRPSMLTVKQAEEIAAEETGGTVKQISRITEKGTIFYTVQAETNKGLVSLKIDGRNGTIIENKRTAARGDSGPNTIIAEEKAKKIALDQIKGDVTDIELDENEDQYEYQVTIKAGSDTAYVYVNAYSGKTYVSWESEDEEDEDEPDEHEEE